MANLELSEEYIALVQARFLDTTPETFYEFQVIIVKFREESMNKSTLFSKVRNLFTTHTDLIQMFKAFLDNLDNNGASSSVDNNRASSSDEFNFVEQEIENQRIVMNSMTDFTKRVQRVFNDDEKFRSFLTMMASFHVNKDVERFAEEGFDLFEEHPELEIEFSTFIAELTEGISAQDKVVSENRKRKEAQDRIDRGNGMWSQVESQEFDIEDGIFERELVYHLIVCAKEDADRLILDNVDTKPLNDRFGTADYFRGLNVKFMGDELKILDKCRLLSAPKPMERGWELSECEKFARLMEREIAILSNDWDEEKKEYFRMSRERDLDITVFDWQAVQRNE